MNSRIQLEGTYGVIKWNKLYKILHRIEIRCHTFFCHTCYKTIFINNKGIDVTPKKVDIEIKKWSLYQNYDINSIFKVDFFYSP